jgi:hypothetical protein
VDAAVALERSLIIAWEQRQKGLGSEVLARAAALGLLSLLCGCISCVVSVSVLVTGFSVLVAARGRGLLCPAPGCVQREPAEIHSHPALEGCLAAGAGRSVQPRYPA